jgi:hypothetical protein
MTIVNDCFKLADYNVVILFYVTVADVGND